MKKRFLLLPLLGLLACNNNGSNQQLLGEWQAVSIYNPQVETILQQQKMLLDTLKQLPEQPAYGMPVEITSLDSFKANGYRELEAMRQYYVEGAAGTRFSFRSDSVVVFTSPDGVDSARFSVEDDSVLVLNERALKGVGDERLVMHIGQLSKDSLTLVVPDRNAESRMTFRKVSEK